MVRKRSAGARVRRRQLQRIQAAVSGGNIFGSIWHGVKSVGSTVAKAAASRAALLALGLGRRQRRGGSRIGSLKF